jgi:uroporphyrinogen III methyltransferase/synthase
MAEAGRAPGTPAGFDRARPLAGRTVVVTRPRGQAEGLAAPLARYGADVLRAPVIEIVPVGLTAELRAAIDRLAEYDVVIFTSANGVEVFCDRLHDCGLAPGALSGAEVVAIGPATAAALEARGLRPSLVPEEYVAEGVLAAFEERAQRLAGARVLLPRAREARAVLPDTLRERGATVDVVTAYETVTAHFLDVPTERLAAADYITFTSSSTVDAFVELMGPELLTQRLARARLCSIGPVTSATLREHGLGVAVEAAEYTSEGLAAALAADAASAAATTPPTITPPASTGEEPPGREAS